MPSHSHTRHTLTIHYSPYAQHHFTITPSKGSPITICFGDLAKAQQWLSLVSEASTNSKQEGNNSKRRWEKRGIEGGSHSRKTSLVDDAMLGTWGSEEGTVRGG